MDEMKPIKDMSADEFSDFIQSRLFDHYPVEGHPGWTCQRAGRMHGNGKYRWYIYKDGKKMSMTQAAVSVEAVFRLAVAFIEDAEQV